MRRIVSNRLASYCLCLAFCSVAEISSAQTDAVSALHAETLLRWDAYLAGVAAAVDEAGEPRPGISIEWHASGNHHFLQSIRISSASLHLPDPLSIGKSGQKDIIRQFGTPQESTPTRLGYRVPGYGGDGSLLFILRNGILSEVILVPFID